MEKTPTKKCPHCQSEIDIKATKCPQCQSDVRSWFARHKAVVVLLVLGVGLPIWGIMSMDSAYVPPEPVVQKTPQAQAVTDNFELGMYRVESEEFQYMEQSEVNLWQSYGKRTKVGSVSEGDEVEVTKHDAVNDYCQIETTDQAGWMACGWLVKIN